MYFCPEQGQFGVDSLAALGVMVTGSMQAACNSYHLKVLCTLMWNSD